MSVTKVEELQELIVRWVFDNSPQNWTKYCHYIELVKTGEDFENSSSSVWFHNNEEVDYRVDVNNRYLLLKLFFELNETMHNSKEYWTTCKMKVTVDGQYNFDFGYDIPPRLMGSAEDLLYHPDYESF
ncbi:MULTISPECIES: hypothetical protein [Psychrobacter]|uniref:hypothetical protein n=1 Tax=Psychrobacter TaxID=497 RepID=UPI0005F05C5F|nr:MULTISPECIES: hypothetical protein [Psychrobacter]